jgi:acid phosphatase (class A)
MIALLVVPMVAGADTPGAGEPAPYFKSTAFDARALLPSPPPDTSMDTVKEVEIILQAQSTRTPGQVDRIKEEESYGVGLFGESLGPWFAQYRPETMPATAALLNRVAQTAMPVVEAATLYWKRPRPFLLNSRIFPAIPKPGNYSYPSGQSIRATLDALVLAELQPDAAEALRARAQEIGDDQVIAGVHFPSDVLAGRILGRAIFARLADDPAFQEDLKQAKAEVAGEMKKTVRN